MVRIACLINSDNDYWQLKKAYSKDWVNQKLFTRIQQPLVTMTGLTNDIELYTIVIPYSSEKLLKLSDAKLLRMTAAINKILYKIGVSTCIVSGELKAFSQFDQYSSSIEPPIIQMLLNKLIDKLFNSASNKISELEVTFIPSESTDELYKILYDISSYYKYVTLLSLSDNSDIIDRIYEQTGLAIRVSRDTKKGLKGCNVLINSSSDIAFLNSVKLDKTTLVINLKSAIKNKVFWNNTVINGIKIILPKSISDKLDNELLLLVSLTEISEAVFCCLCNTISNNLNNSAAIIFDEYGFEIESIIGHRNIISLKEYEQYLKAIQL